MTREEAIKIINCYDIGFYDLSGEKIPADKLADAFDMAIEALSEPINENREIIKDILQMMPTAYLLEALGVATFDELMDSERTGEWVLKEHLWECDQCGCRINRANPLKGNIWNYYFCPNCGARMCKGGDE